MWIIIILFLIFIFFPLFFHHAGTPAVTELLSCTSGSVWPTWEGLGTWFGGKASCPDHLHLQLTLLVHQTDLDIAYTQGRNTEREVSHLHLHLDLRHFLLLLPPVVQQIARRLQALTHGGSGQRLPSDQLPGTQTIQEVAELTVGTQPHPWEDQTDKARTHARAHTQTHKNKVFCWNSIKSGAWLMLVIKGHSNNTVISVQQLCRS